MRKCDAEKDQLKTETHRHAPNRPEKNLGHQEGPANLQTRGFSELLIDCEEDRTLRAVLVGDAARRRQVGGEARTSDVGFRFRLRRRLPLPPRARRPRSPIRVHGRYCP
jgi:hypothetical protein